MCFQSGSIRIVRFGLAFLWVWALHIAYSHAVMSFSDWHSGSDIYVPVYVVSMSNSDENSAYVGPLSSRSWI